MAAAPAPTTPAALDTCAPHAMTALPGGVSRAQAERTSALEGQQTSAEGAHRSFGTAEVC